MGVINLDGSDRSIAALSVFPTVDRIELLSVRAVKQGEGRKEGVSQGREGIIYDDSPNYEDGRTDGRACGGSAIIAGDASEGRK